jgi:hypothetical protein
VEFEDRICREKMQLFKQHTLKAIEEYSNKTDEDLNLPSASAIALYKKEILTKTDAYIRDAIIQLEALKKQKIDQMKENKGQDEQKKAQDNQSSTHDKIETVEEKQKKAQDDQEKAQDEHEFVSDKQKRDQDKLLLRNIYDKKI